jgi:hypothetical protein
MHWFMVNNQTHTKGMLSTWFLKELKRCFICNKKKNSENETLLKLVKMENVNDDEYYGYKD